MPTLQRERESAQLHSGVRMFAARRRGSRGATAVEFAMVLPVLLVLMLSIVYYGVILAMQQVLTLAAEEGARAALRYQSSNTLRVAAAYTAVNAALPSFISSQVTTNQSGSPLVTCPTIASMQCLSVVLTLPVTTGTTPLLPSIPLLPVPSTLTGSAVVQLVPGS
ncbi:TadE/TadG family type IV pilus assembly protein [Ralstonia insidiosa]|uniref:Pilus assembly protein n=1 Tax=Ralstonia insidiosa TaxID=190721 RepID=A0A848P8W3_9RALS|nr:TadE/TadG family type IV pilus assembly protein [Ralstonia insidiosa]NMV40008.1 pilus assembly protein [Ralstonia insidiosa]